ncbi:TetR family transcriptional regulator [Pontibacillus halophilus JSM 076056 = DSM 19796]|uniref:TetR family transcriptional regulator n=1 Tax=Pontibacillus halophilus JSM 076056 = DSM 19796 TaxID=1385510 RepID=A0A0A5GDJ3_9BACI|nr:TetR/AcrR family transcriptional regulator [Pontibacillus halophilus]KGX91291.1 TetR family transcriptional regulator [Pontibacillus halophilus JSM 076056 = DSM 19796]
MKDKIMETSIELFGERGFLETSIQDIVEANGVTKGTFYYYFHNKEDVLMQIHLTFIEELLKRQEQILFANGVSYKEKLRSTVLMVIKNIRLQAQSARVFFREMRHLSDHHTAKLLPKRHLFQRNVQQLVEEGVRAEEFRKDLRADMVSFGILGIVNWSYFWYEPDGEVSEEELTDIYVSMMLEGLQPPRT